MFFVSNRNFVLRSTSGHSIRFERGVAISVPNAVKQEALEKGCIPCDEKGKMITSIDEIPSEPVSTRPQAPEDDATRAEEIVKAMAIIVKRNKPKEFSGPMPSALAISAELGWATDHKEARKVWEANRADLVGNGKGE